jgi:pimeloyl-ACP methyl ester carboxylesterase
MDAAVSNDGLGRSLLRLGALTIERVAPVIGKAAGKAVPVVGGLAVGIGAGVTIERIVMRAVAGRADPEAAERFGRFHGRPAFVTSTDGTRLHVEELGDGPCLVFAHGFSLNGDAWHYQRRDLPGQGFRCTFLDHRGHGRSEPAPGGPLGDYSLGALARDLAVVLGHASAPGGRVVLVAHSMSGFVALTLAREGGLRAHGVAGLVLVDTAYADTLRAIGAALAARGARKAQLSLLGPAYRLMGRRAHLAHMLRRRGSDLGYLGTRLMGFGAHPSPRQVAFVDQLLAGTKLDVWASVLPGLLDFDLGDALARLDVPTLVVAGEADRVTPPAAARHMAATIRDAELLLLPGAGHMAFMEAHERFNAALAAFARGCLGQPG